jgi:hypothetical protein
MTGTIKALIRLSMVTMVGAGALLWSGKIPQNLQQSLISSAQAVIGRPLTPLSYAGVARRTTRRAVGAGAVYGAPVVVVAPAPVVVGPSCVQAVDAYGRLYTRCY